MVGCLIIVESMKTLAAVILNFGPCRLCILHLPVLGGVSVSATWVHVMFLSVYVRRMLYL